MGCSVSTRGDVYSYGILLLEMFTNKTPTDDSFKDEMNLHSFVTAALPHRVMEVADPLFLTVIDTSKDMIEYCMASIMSIGVSCSNKMPRYRLSMKDVVSELEMIKKLLCS